MRKAKIAELILATTTTPEQAAPIIGDLVEEEAKRGALWFWNSLLRITTSLSWRAFADAPFRLAGRAIVGAIVQVFYILAVYLFVMFLQLCLHIVTGLTTNMAFLPQFDPAHPLAIATNVVSSLAAAYLFGRWLARKVPQREFPVYVMTWLLYQSLWVVVLLQDPPFMTEYGLFGDFLMNALMTIGGTIFTFAGIERTRLLDPRRPASFNQPS